MVKPRLGNKLVTLEPADSSNIDLLIEWTLDPVAQGPYKRVPTFSAEELRHALLFGEDRQYFMIRRADNGHPLGRFYWRAWRFDGADGAIDWELNILLADPADRGHGLGSAVQRMAAEYLAALPESRSVFAFTLMTNEAERRALLNAGFIYRGVLPHSRYPLALPEDRCVLFVWPDSDAIVRRR